MAAYRIFLTLLFVLLARSARADFDTFRAVVGLDDGVIGRTGTVRFFVEADGKRVLETGVMRPGDPARTVEIPIAGAKELRLIVDDARDGHGGDWGDWADARLVDSRTGDTLFLSDLDTVVEREWIATRMDRNLVQNPLTLNGTVYAKGLGADSGSAMVYRDWQKVWDRRQAEARRLEEEAAAKWGVRALLTGKPASGLTVINNKTLSLVWNKPVGTVVVGWEARTGLKLAGVPLERLTPDKIEHLVPGEPPKRAGEPPVVLNGKPYYGGVSAGVPVRLTWTHPLSAARACAEIPPYRGQGLKFLYGRVGLDRRGATGQGTARFRALFDGRVVFDSGLVTPKSRPIQLQIPFTNPKEMRLIVSDGGDGGYADAADWVDMIVPDPQGRALLPLSDFRPFAWTQNWGAPQFNRAVSGDAMLLGEKPLRQGIGVAAPSEIVYRDLSTAVARRAKAAEALDALGWQQTAFAKKTGDVQGARAKLDAMLREDPECVPLRYAAARLANDAGQPAEAEAHLKRLLDIGRTALPALRAAAQYDLRELRAGRPMSAPFFSRRPQEAYDPRLTPIDLLSLIGEPRELEMGAQDAWGQEQTAVVRFRVREDETRRHLGVLIASAGLAVQAWLFKGDDLPQENERQVRAVARAEGRNPTLRGALSPGNYALLLTHDPAKDGVLLPFRVAMCAAAALQPSPPSPLSLKDGRGGANPSSLRQARGRLLIPPPSEQWAYTIQNDGSARVEMSADAPTVLLIPHTAEEIVFADARAIPIPAAFEYGSTLEFPHTLGQTVLLVPEAGTRGTVRFLWRDAAYDVPMAHYAKDHAKKHFFSSLRGINPESVVQVAVTLPPTVKKVTRIAPESVPSADRAYRWVLPADRAVVLEAENPALESRWISAKHRNMTVWLPDAEEYRTWLPRYRDLLARIYDRESFLMGDYETREERFLYVTGPAQLSGFGGATWGDPNLSETWIPCTGRVGAYNLTAQPGGDGVEAHELKWVHLGGGQPDGPFWLRRGMTIWLEEQGKLAGDTGFPDQWAWTELMPKAAQYRDRFHGPGSGFVWMTEAAVNALPAADRRLTDAMCWHICQTLHARYGDTFWNRFWKRQRENPAPWKTLDEAAKTRRVVEEMIQMTGDTALRAQFAEWGFVL